MESLDFNKFFFTVDCEVGPWGNWTSCSVTCGGGTKERNRTAIPAQYGGANCTGNDTEHQTCNDNIPCPGIFIS